MTFSALTASRGSPAVGRITAAAAMFLAPLLFALSSFAWVGDGQYGVTGSALLVFGSIAWILALIGVFGSLRDVTPRYSVAGLVFAIYGAVCGGVAFAFQGMFAALYGIPHDQAIRALADHPVVANAIFWVGGPVFPLSLALLGIVLARTRVVAPWAGILLALGGALFPIARIPRVAALAHTVDLMLLVPMWYVGARTFRGRLDDSPRR